MYNYTHTHARACAHTHKHVHTLTHALTHAHAHTRTHTHTYRHTPSLCIRRRRVRKRILDPRVSLKKQHEVIKVAGSIDEAIGPRRQPLLKYPTYSTVKSAGCISAYNFSERCFDEIDEHFVPLLCQNIYFFEILKKLYQCHSFFSPLKNVLVKK